MNCKDAARLLSEKRDRRLSWRARISLRLHMLACKMCKVYGSQLDTVGRVCREAGLRAEHNCPGELPDERKQRIKDAMTRDPRDR
ncbi:MAG TPA: zf-HC2 domain-containing protein [Candidatus Krumholzibacteria bacterium]|nr:zf-HC2 domain-containing protein [Candidatus Krumholzibacteria bacterium]